MGKIIIIIVIIIMSFIVGDFGYDIVSIEESTVEIITYVGTDTAVNIPSTVEYNGTTYTVISIATDVFKDKIFITSFTFNEPCYIQYFKNNCFSGTSITNFVMPNSVITIGYSCFYNCSLLTDVTLSTSLTNIGSSNTFYGTALSSILIPSSVTFIGYQVFGQLNNVIIEDQSKCTVFFSSGFGPPSYSFAANSGTITMYNTAGYNNLSDNWKQNVSLFSTIIYKSGPYSTQQSQSPTITVFVIPAKAYGSAQFEISQPISDSSGPFSYTSSDLLVANISENIITIVGPGSTEITATQGETSDYTSGTITTQFQVTESTPTNPVIINTGHGLEYFMNTTSTYANIVNSLALDNILIGSSNKVLTAGNDVKLTSTPHV